MNIVQNERKRVYVISRLFGLLISCAWINWSRTSSEINTSFEIDNVKEIFSSVFDGVGVSKF